MARPPLPDLQQGAASAHFDLREDELQPGPPPATPFLPHPSTPPLYLFYILQALRPPPPVVPLAQLPALSFCWVSQKNFGALNLCSKMARNGFWGVFWVFLGLSEAHFFPCCVLQVVFFWDKCPVSAQRSPAQVQPKASLHLGGFACRPRFPATAQHPPPRGQMYDSSKVITMAVNKGRDVFFLEKDRPLSAALGTKGRPMAAKFQISKQLNF